MSEVAPRDRLRPLIRAWFTSLETERGVSTHTLASYQDAWRLLKRYGIEQQHLAASGDWRLSQVDRAFVLGYLVHLEKGRGCSIATRNTRLAAIQSFFRWLRLAEPEPALRVHADRILGIPSKRCPRPIIDYLERDELQAVLLSVDRTHELAVRDLALLCVAYNTGARAQELADLRLEGLKLSHPATVRIWGKGRKVRELPLWESTVERLNRYLKKHRSPANDLFKPYAFLNHRGQRMTRWGTAGVIQGAMAIAAQRCPSMAKKRLSAHGMRHTTAVHLLQSGVDIVTIQNWLGHESPDTVSIYLALDLKHRQDLLERCLRIDELLPDDNYPGDPF